MSCHKIKIMLVDDHFMARIGLALPINQQPDMQVIAEACNGEEALELYRQHLPDVVIMDYALPDKTGPEIVAAIRILRRVVDLALMRHDEVIVLMAEGKAAVSEQATALRDTRDRAGTLMTTAAAVATIGTGLAFSNRYKGQDNVAVAYFGDGTSNQGQVYEAFNMASLWKLPVVYVIENNQYAMGTSIARASAETELFKRGISFEIPGEMVDGMDVLAVRKAAAKAVQRARDGEGPYILEMKTYRYRGHSMSDPAKYRTKEEVDDVKKNRDPIDLLRDKLEAAKVGEDAFKAIDAEVKAIVAEAVEFAKESPEPDPAELYTEIYLEAAQ